MKKQVCVEWEKDEERDVGLGFKYFFSFIIGRSMFDVGRSSLFCILSPVF
jgi:hypothetical protein